MSNNERNKAFSSCSIIFFLSFSINQTPLEPPPPHLKSKISPRKSENLLCSGQQIQRRRSVGLLWFLLMRPKETRYLILFHYDGGQSIYRGLGVRTASHPSLFSISSHLSGQIIARAKIKIRPPSVFLSCFFINLLYDFQTFLI